MAKKNTTGFRCAQCRNEVECFLNEENIKSYMCYNCGTRYDVETIEEECQEDYPYYNKDIEDTTEDTNHGCDMKCPVCDHWTVISRNFMRSEVCGDVDEDNVDEFGCLVDDSIVTDIVCPHCGTLITVIPCKPSEEKDYPFFNDTDKKIETE